MNKIILTIMLAACAVTAGAVPANSIDHCMEFAQTIIGAKYDEDLQSRVAAQQLSIRVIAKDGKFFPATRDYRPDRLNIEIKDGAVVRAFCG